MKVFGIGLSKTGTTSLAAALEILGYHTKDYPGVETYHPGDLSSLDADLLESHDAFTDTPIPSLYPALDAAFPGSKFILTVRDMEGWLKSCRKQFTQKLADKQNDAHNRLFVELYGTAVFDEALFRAGYERFVQGVTEYFKDRPGDLLILDVTAGEGWEKLCPFLGKSTPVQPFPKANVTSIQWMDIHAVVNLAIAAGEELRSAHLAFQPDIEHVAWQQHLAALFNRAKFSLGGGGRAAALRSATEACSERLSQGLARLSPGIPVVDRTTASPERQDAKWNHFWLVDPLDGESGFASNSGEYSVNIALIQDQKPIAGVVYAPVSQQAYFAMQGKGAHKQEVSGTPVRLGEAAGQNSPTPSPASVALALCHQLESGQGNQGEVEGSMEWQTAPAHAIMRAAGRRLQVCETGQEMTYNKAGWINPRVKTA